jgi:hypothetical protein
MPIVVFVVLAVALAVLAHACGVDSRETLRRFERVGSWAPLR